jgi:hypothetical protein
MEQTNTSPSIIKNFGSTPSVSKMKMSSLLLLVAAAVIVGVGIGYLPSIFNKTATSETSEKSEVKTAGIVDKKTFKDSAEGTLKEGGIDGEGNFHLERPGGESQNVYLTSTTVDLSSYIGKKVKVWGQTFEAQAAGWFMDVGLVEPLK